MTEDEAETIAKIAMTVDRGCPSCQTSICEELIYHFPETDWPTLMFGYAWSDGEYMDKIKAGVFQ